MSAPPRHDYNTSHLPLGAPKIFIFSETTHDFRSKGQEFEVIDYNVAYPHQRVIEALHNILKDSQRYNQQVLVVCNSMASYEGVRKPEAHYDISRSINSTLDYFFVQNPTSRLGNVVILHATDDIGRVVFDLRENSRVRSITNVLFSKTGMNTRIFNEGLAPKLHDRIRCGVKVRTQHKEFFHTPHPTTGKILHRFFSYRLLCEDPPSQSKKGKIEYIEDRWWYKVFLSIPRCAEGRLIQQAGTCWWDAIMNSLFLTPVSADLLRLRWYNEDPTNRAKIMNNYTLKNCADDQNLHRRDFMLILIYYILIMRDRAQTYEINASKNAGARTIAKKNDISSRGSHYTMKLIDPKANLFPEKGTRNYVASNEGASPFPGVKAIARDNLKQGTQYNVINLTREEAKKFGENSTHDYTFSTSKDAREAREGLRNAMRKYAYEDVEYNAVNLQERSAWFEKYPSPPMIFVGNDRTKTKEHTIIKRAPQKITVDRRTYSLESAVFWLVDHAITGFTCTNAVGERERYIFDPQNVLSKDDWPNGSLKVYERMRRERGWDIYNFIGICYLLYSLDP